MKKDWIEQVKIRIAEKAGIDAKKYKTIEATAKRAAKKLRLKSLEKGEAEDMTSYTTRLLKHFGLGHDFDAKVPDAAARKRRETAWRNYQNCRMGIS